MSWKESKKVIAVHIFAPVTRWLTANLVVTFRTRYGCQGGQCELHPVFSQKEVSLNGCIWQSFRILRTSWAWTGLPHTGVESSGLKVFKKQVLPNSITVWVFLQTRSGGSRQACFVPVEGCGRHSRVSPHHLFLPLSFFLSPSSSHLCCSSMF